MSGKPSITRVVKYIRRGVGISYTEVEYADSTSNSTAPTSGWQTNAPAWKNGHYIWQRVKFVYTDGAYQYSNPVCLSGGKGISSITEYYLATSASSGVTTSTSGWTTGVQSVTATKKYLWNYEVVTYTDGSTTTTTPVIIGVYGDKGVGISSITEYYLATAASSGVTTANGSWGTWTTAIQTVTASKKYLWNYEVVTYTDGSSKTTTPVIIGTYGDKGDKGDTGNGISSITEYYLATSASSGVTTSTIGLTTGVQSVTATKKYLWMNQVIAYTNGTSQTIPPMIIGAYGDKGNTGDPGAPGGQGSRGPALRGPQAWSDCEVGYQFYSGAEGEPYKDIVLYNGYFYSCKKTHQKATNILPTNITYWTLGDKVELIAANVLFAEHGFFGDAIISGQWLISANGTINGTAYTKGQTYNSELAYNLFNADSPLGDDITRYNNTQGTSISSTEATAQKGTVNLEAGRVYYMTCVGFTNVASNLLYVRLVKSDDSSVSVTPINLNSTSAVTRSGYAHITKSGTYRIELYHSTGNGNGVLNTCKIVEKCFAPVYALNLRTGKVYQNDAYISGKVEANLFYSKTRAVTDATNRTYYINPETEPAGTYFINEPTNKRFIYLPDANVYDGLEIEIFTKCTNWNVDKMTFVAAQNGQSLFLKTSVMTAASYNGGFFQAERLDVEYKNYNNTTAYMIPNEMHRFKSINGAWYSIQGHYTGE